MAANLLTYTSNEVESILYKASKELNFKFKFDFQGEDFMSYYDVTSTTHFFYFIIESPDEKDIDFLLKRLSNHNKDIRFDRLFYGKDWEQFPKLSKIKDNNVLNVTSHIYYRTHILIMVNIIPFREKYKLKLLRDRFMDKLRMLN